MALCEASWCYMWLDFGRFSSGITSLQAQETQKAARGPFIYTGSSRLHTNHSKTKRKKKQSKNRGMHGRLFPPNIFPNDVEWLNEHTAWYNMQISVARNSESRMPPQLPGLLSDWRRNKCWTRRKCLGSRCICLECLTAREKERRMKRERNKHYKVKGSHRNVCGLLPLLGEH